MSSPRFSVSGLDLKHLFVTGLLVAASAVITYVVDKVIPDLMKTPEANIALMGMITMFLKALQKFITDTRPEVIGLIVAVCLSAVAVGAYADQPVVTAKPVVPVAAQELAQAPPLKVTWNETKPTVAPATTAPAAAVAAAGLGRRELTLRQRRAMGLTFPKILEAAKALKESGEIDKQSSDSEIAAAIAMKLASDNPQGFAGDAALDWEAIVAFIEQFLPLILKLIALFG